MAVVLVVTECWTSPWRFNVETYAIIIAVKKQEGSYCITPVTHESLLRCASKEIPMDTAI